MSKLLVTGCLGFIGSYFCKYYLEQHPDATITGLNRPTNSKNMKRIEPILNNDRFSLLQRDLTEDISGVAEDADYIVNFAAKTFVDHSIRDPKPFLMSNLIGTFNLLEEAKRDPKLKKYLQVSTDEVYGSILEGKYKEDAPLNPTNPYASAKAAADMLCVAYFNTYKLPIIITRTENNYGPFQHPQKAMPVFIKNAIEGKNLPVYGDGLHRRMWLYVEDHCSAIEFLLENGTPGQIYHVAGEKELTNIELSTRILEFVKSKVETKSELEFISDYNIRPGHDRRYALDVSKLKNLGWSPKFDLDYGFNLAFNWYFDNYNTWLR